MMRRFVLLILPPALLVVAGCTTKAKARAEAARAFAAGQEQAAKEARTQQPVVTFIGPVRNRVVPWQEGLTLANALDAAVYTGFSDPRFIRLSRGAERVEVRVKDLLRGAVNPILEPGDIIEISQ